MMLNFREKNNNIAVVDLSGENRPIPHPVRKFEEAFRPYRKFLFSPITSPEKEGGQIYMQDCEYGF